jgi:hypothetical protein
VGGRRREKIEIGAEQINEPKMGKACETHGMEEKIKGREFLGQLSDC